MSIIIFIIIVLIIVALLIWAVSMLTIIPAPINQIIMALIVILGVVIIAQKAGVFYDAMKDFTDTTRTQYISGGAHRPGLRGAAQMSSCMKTFKTGGRVVAGPTKPCGCK